MQKNKQPYSMVSPFISGHSAPGAGNVWYWAGGVFFLFIIVIALTKFTGYYLQLMTAVAVSICSSGIATTVPTRRKSSTTSSSGPSPARLPGE